MVTGPTTLGPTNVGPFLEMHGERKFVSKHTPSNWLAQPLPPTIKPCSWLPLKCMGSPNKPQVLRKVVYINGWALELPGVRRCRMNRLPWWMLGCVSTWGCPHFCNGRWWARLFEICQQLFVSCRKSPQESSGNIGGELQCVSFSAIVLNYVPNQPSRSSGSSRVSGVSPWLLAKSRCHPAIHETFLVSCHPLLPIMCCLFSDINILVCCEPAFYPWVATF